MTIRDLLESVEVSMDVIDDYDESCWIAYDGEKLTDEGKEYFKDILDLKVKLKTYYGGCPLGVIEIPDGNEEKTVAKVRELFETFAGYCTVEEYDKLVKKN